MIPRALPVERIVAWVCEASATRGRRMDLRCASRRYWPMVSVYGRQMATLVSPRSRN